MRFFEGMVNDYYFSSVKTKVQDAQNFYRENEGNHVTKNLRRQVLFNAFSAWLTDPVVRSKDIYVHSLAPRFNTALLIACQEGKRVRAVLFLKDFP